jgi:TolB-like protein
MREARVAAAISHPLICQVYELGEWEGQPFIAMELLNGEPLAARLVHGALTPREAFRVAVGIVDALAVLHRHHVIHRDLKPSNIFVTNDAVKVLDFGLARPTTRDPAVEAITVTHAGTIIGTPQYAAPEQLSGEAVDERADLFSAGAILFEMLAGRPAFPGATLAAVVHAVLYETPPVLGGSPAIAAADRILYRALAKRADDRYPSAEVFAEELRHVMTLVDDDSRAEARPILRLAVLPFRPLIPDAEIDYLSVSFADALVSAFSGYESLVVRPIMQSARYATVVPDLNLLSVELAVDVVITGAILKTGDRLEVRAELRSAPAGDLWWNQTTDVETDRLFELRDQIAQRVVMSLPLSRGDQGRRGPVVPRVTRAFDLYLRGMQLRMEASSWRQARSFFERSIEADPTYAPAWAERGRIDRVLGKFEDPTLLANAEAAFVRALELDPADAATQHYYAQLELDTGRVEAAIERLLARLRRQRAEPQAFAALVQACRYGGLLDESVAAHERARHLDPTVATSVLHTFYQRGQFPRAVEESYRTSDPFEARVLGAMGRTEEALAVARQEEARFGMVPVFRGFATGLRAAFEGKRDESFEALRVFDTGFSDGEGLFYVAEIYACIDHPEDAHAMLDRAVRCGFACVPAFDNSTYLRPLRTDRRWASVVERARQRSLVVAEAFERAGGRGLLGT